MTRMMDRLAGIPDPPRWEQTYVQLKSRPAAQNLRIKEVLGRLGYSVYGRDCLSIMVPPGRTVEDIAELVLGAVGEQVEWQPPKPSPRSSFRRSPRKSPAKAVAAGG